MAALKRFRVLASPDGTSGLAGEFVFAGFAVSVVAVMLYGQDYAVPAVALGLTAIGHAVSYRERAQKRGTRRQVLLAGLIFATLAYFLADSVSAFFGGTLPQANFATPPVAATRCSPQTPRHYS